MSISASATTLAKHQDCTSVRLHWRWSQLYAVYGPTVRLPLDTLRHRGHPSLALVCHVWTAPGWQGESHVAGWSVQPCVRPVCAVHMTAGHNAFRGSGPGQKPAFEMHWH